ncbi:Transposase [Rhizobiales bacterium GAS113]|nr:Transposase [Rhizobiales bacterium GAS113]
MARLGMPVGHTTILRDVKRSARTHADPALVRVAGIDDWAWRKGMTYGTVIVDLERRRVVDLLPDRSAASTAKWLKGRPEVEVVSRDRAGLYAEGAREGAPQARQVADRFHLLRNFREAIERQLGRFEAPIREAPVPAVNDETGPELSVAQGPGGRSDTAEHRHFARRARRAAHQALFDQIRALYDAGKTVTAIAWELGLGRRRVDPWRRKHARRPTTKPSCRAAGPRGITAVRRLFDDIRQRGYTGSYSHLARFLAPWRNIARPLDGMSGRPPSPSNYETPAPSPMLDPMTGRQISPQTAAALCVKPRGQMTPRQILNVDALKAASPEFATMRQLAMRFRGLLRGGSLEKLDVWLRDAHLSSIYAIRRFVRTLRQDIGAVRNAVLEPWSNGLSSTATIRSIHWIASRMAAGCALAELGDVQRGSEILERAIENDPSNAQAWVALGTSQCFLENMGDVGLEKLRHGMRLSPRDHRLGFWGTFYALALARHRRLTEAHEEVRAACRRDPRFYVARIVLALTAAGLGRKEEAMAALREAGRLRPRLSLEEIQLLVGRGAALLAPLWREVPKSSQ